jgi:hypothetical protein
VRVIDDRAPAGGRLIRSGWDDGATVEAGAASRPSNRWSRQHVGTEIAAQPRLQTVGEQLASLDEAAGGIPGFTCGTSDITTSSTSAHDQTRRVPQRGRALPRCGGLIEL